MAKPRVRSPESRLSEAWQAIYNSVEGRLAISELLLSTGVYSEIQADNPTLLALQIGERNVGARIARHIGLKADEYPQHATDATDLVGRFIDHTN